MRDAIQRQLLVEARFLLFLFAGIGFLMACGIYAAWAGSLGTLGAVLLVVGLAIIAALIIWELTLFWRRYAR
jgi:hypothetical protein